VRGGKTVSEMENESARGSKKEGKKRRPETEHSLPKTEGPTQSPRRNMATGEALL